MAKGAGIGSKMALAPATRWGSASNVNVANAAIDYLSEDFGFAVPEFIDDASVSRSWPGDPIRGNIVVNGSVRTYLRYQGCERLLAYPMGVAAAPSLLETGVYRHKYTYTSDVYGKFCTVAIDKGVSVHEYESFKFAGFTITWQAGRPTEMQSRGFGNNNNVPAVQNTSLANATFRSEGDHVLWAHGSLLVAAKAGGAPTSTTDQYMPSSMELTYDRPLSQHYVLNNSAEIIEPILDGAPSATMRLTFPRYATAPAGTPGNTFANWAKQNIAVKMWLRFVGATLGATQRRRFDLYAMNASVANVVSNVGGPAAIPQEVTLNLRSAQAVPTGLPAWVGRGGLALGLTTGMATAPI
jgi:hypothetical protein